MIVKKFLKGFMAAALAVTMAVTPVSSVKAAEVMVTSGASTYTFSQEPVAAFVVTGWIERSIILYCVPKGTQVHSQAGSSEWTKNIFATEEIPNDYKPVFYEGNYMENEENGKVDGEATREDGSPYLRLSEIYHSDIAGFDAVYVMENVGVKSVMLNSGQAMNGHYEWTEDAFDITVIPEVFALSGASAVQIPVADALAMDNANIQLDTANTQTAEAQAQAAQAEALSAQQAAEAQAQAEALSAQQAAEAAAQAQAEAQQAAEAAAQAQAEAQQAAAQVQPQPSITSASQGTYTVEANDNLCKIAQKVYGDMKAWREIYKANPTIKDDYVIYKGQVLVIPTR